MDYKRYINEDKINKINQSQVKIMREKNIKLTNPLINVSKILDEVYRRINEVNNLSNNISEKEEMEHLDNINNTLFNFFEEIDFFSIELIREYNNKFKFFSNYNKDLEINNPFMIEKKELMNFLKNEDKNQSRIELQLKLMQLCNRSAHVMDQMKEYVLRKFLNDVNKKNEQKNDSDVKHNTNLNQNKRLYTKLYSEMDTNNFFDSFINEYEECLNKFSSAKEGEKEGIIKKFNTSESVKEFKKKFKENNNNNYPFSIKFFYEYSKLSNLSECMYESKDLMIEKALYSYLEEKNSGVCKITKSTDNSTKGYNSSKNVINFHIKGYNSPYSVHILNKDANSTYDSIINNLDIEKDIMTYSTIQYKYSDDNLRKIVECNEKIKCGDVIYPKSERGRDYFYTFKSIVNQICNNIDLNKNKNKKEVDIIKQI